MTASDGTVYKDTFTYDFGAQGKVVAAQVTANMVSAKWNATLDPTGLAVTITQSNGGKIPGSVISNISIQTSGLDAGGNPIVGTNSGVTRKPPVDVKSDTTGTKTPWEITVTPGNGVSVVDENETFQLIIDGVELDYNATQGQSPSQVINGLYVMMVADGFDDASIAPDGGITFTNDQAGLLTAQVFFNINTSSGSAASNTLTTGIAIPNYSGLVG